MPRFIAGLVPKEITKELGISPSFRGTQIFRWIHSGVTEFAGMTNISRNERERLSEQAAVFSSGIEERFDDIDSTVKLRLRLHDGALTECVLLTDGEHRKTACISSQAGCPVACLFCKTGRLGFTRNLESFEIVEQLLHLKTIENSISHIVFMGMGEPLLNMEQVRKAIEVLHHRDGADIGLRKITVSTSGIPDQIRDFSDRGPRVNLAVSLISARGEIRESLIPGFHAAEMQSLKDSIVYYQKSSQRRITLEMVLLKGINDDRREVEALASFIRDLNVLINVIPWNPVKELGFNEPEQAVVKRFMDALQKRNIRAALRYRKGRGSSAACGQLGC